MSQDETETPRPDSAENADAAPAEDSAPEEQPAAAPEDAATVEELQASLSDMHDRLLRAAAEADNARKRAERDVAEARLYSVTGFARDIIGVNDNLARALAALTPEMREGMREAGRTLLDGVEMTQKALHAALSRHGVEPIAANPGETFDPNVHQAAAQIPSPHPAGAIVEVMQEGWKIGDRVLRAAMVAVSSGAPAQSPPSGGEESDGGGSPGSDGPPPGSSVDTKV